MSKIKELRIKAGLTQVELANKLGIKQPSVASWEINPNRKPNTKYVPKLARIFKCNVGQLYQLLYGE